MLVVLEEIEGIGYPTIERITDLSFGLSRRPTEQAVGCLMKSFVKIGEGHPVILAPQGYSALRTCWRTER